jgi:hypothetical protein
MTAGEQTSDSEFNSLILAHDHFTNLLCESVNVIRHFEIICGNDSIRKWDMQLRPRSVIPRDWLMSRPARRGFRRQWGRGGMRFAITFCNETEHERPKNKYHNSSFHGREAEPLYRPIQFGVLLHLVFPIATEPSLLTQSAAS